MSRTSAIAGLCAGLAGCSLIAPIQGHTFDLTDGGGVHPDAPAAADAGLDGGHCSLACTMPTPVCDPRADRCVQCVADADCDDRDPCTSDTCEPMGGTCSHAIVPSCVAQLALGGTHSCARYAGGRVRCWGGNRYGQVGDGTTGTYSLGPVDVSGITDAVDIDSGSNFSCAVLRSGGVMCWGAGTQGQLGNRMALDSATPVAVLALSDAVELAAGANHACVRRSDHTVSCWGAGVSGQLGDGLSGTGHQTLVPSPVRLTGVDGIAAALDRTCAVLGDHTARCWGANDMGDLGNGVTSPVVASPTVVSGVGDAVQIGDHCTRSGTGAVTCWGSNLYGQVGDGTMTQRPRPVAVMNLADAIDIANGATMSCARRATGQTLCWGRNDEGQLGIDLSGVGTQRLTPTEVMNLPDAIQVAIGGQHACAIRVSGAVACWGANGTHQVSNASPGNHLVPFDVEGL